MFLDNVVNVLFGGLAGFFGRLAFERVDDSQMGRDGKLPPCRVTEIRRAPAG